jgi:hypothetical protein
VAAVGVFFLLMLLWFVVALIFRLRFHYSLLAMFVLTVAVALPCSWLSWEMKQAGEQKKAVDGYGEWLVDTRRDWQIDGDGKILSSPRPPEPAWLRTVLGSDFFDSIVLVSFLGNIVTDRDVQEVQRFRQLRWLDVHTEFDPHQGHISDTSLAYLEALTQLQGLDLQGTHVTDAGLAHLARLSQLRELRLNGTQVTDSGLQLLRGLNKLHWLWLYHTRVTDAGVRALQQALPNCEISH